MLPAGVTGCTGSRDERGLFTGSPDTLGYGGLLPAAVYSLSCSISHYLNCLSNVQCPPKRHITLNVLTEYSFMSNRKYLRLADGLVANVLHAV